MKYTKEVLKNKHIQFEVELDAHEWEHLLEHAYEHEKGKFNIQGFRKGKAPRQIIEKMYGESVFYDHALEHAFYDYYGEILDKEKDVEPIANPKLDVKKIDKSGVTLLIEVEVKPEVKLGEYKGLTIKKMDTLVSDAEVNAELLLSRDKASRLVEVDREIKVGDTVTFDFSGSIDGKKFDGGTAENYDLEIGSGQFIPGFEEQMVGLKKGETKDLTVTFPKDYHADNLKGKESVFTVTIHSVREKEMPELNDELAQNMSEFDTLKDWEESVRKELTAKKEQNATYQAENDLIQTICDNSSVEAPEVMVEEQIDAFIKEFEYRLMYQGLKLDDYLKMVGTTKEELRKDRREDAIKTVKTRLVLEEIIKQEKITVEKEEFALKIKELSTKANKSEEEYQKSLNEHQLEHIVNDMIVNKLLEFLRKNNNL